VVNALFDTIKVGMPLNPDSQKHDIPTSTLSKRSYGWAVRSDPEV
jgi:hypothetical protein